MGDMADDDFDAGLDVYLAHRRGECGQDGPCPYCDDEDEDCLGCGYCVACIERSIAAAKEGE